MEVIQPSGGSSSGNVVGPASSTDNALAVWDGATGLLLKDSTIINTAGVLSGLAGLQGTGTIATSGFQRLANNTLLAWRNAGNTANLTLTMNASDSLLSTAANLYINSGGFTDTLGVGSNSTFGYGIYVRNNNGTFFAVDNGSDCGLSIVRSAASFVRIGTGSTGRKIGLADDDGTVDTVTLISGAVTIGRSGATPTHRLNTATGTAATDVLTLTNGPAGKAGNPAVYLTLNINGTARQIPAW